MLWWERAAFSLNATSAVPVLKNVLLCKAIHTTIAARGTYRSSRMIKILPGAGHKCTEHSFLIMLAERGI